MDDSQQVKEMSQRYGWKEVLKPQLEKNIDIANKNLQSIDPFKNPTDLARKQGYIEGLQYILNFVNKRSG